jgi:hypothetical protein
MECYDLIASFLPASIFWGAYPSPKMIVFGDRAFKEVIKVNEVIRAEL